MMESAFRIMRASSRRGLGFTGALALLSCTDSGSSFPGSHIFPLPVPAGGMLPVEGSDLLDGSFVAVGVFESFAFVERQPIRVIVDRFSRPLIVGIGSQPSGLLLLRLTEAGASDPTFGTDGAVLLPNDAAGTVTYTPRATDILIDVFDRILLFSTRTTGDGERAVVVRLDPNGVPDPSFGVEGRAVLEPTPGTSETRAVSLVAASLGGFFACADELGPGGARMIVARLDDAGLLDFDFGVEGIARGPEDEDSVGVRVLRDDAERIVVAGNLPAGLGRIALWRFDTEGSPDPGFGVGGLVMESGSDAALGVQAFDAALDAMGEIVLLGQRSHDLSEIDDWPTQLVDFRTHTAPVFDAVVWRFLPDGAPDPAFADGGSKVLAFNSGPYTSVSGGSAGGDHFDAAAGLFLDDAGRIVVAGWSDPATWNTALGWATFGPTRPFLVRLTPSGALDADFHGDGHAQLGWDFATLTTGFLRGHVTSIAHDMQGRWVLAGGSVNGSSQRVWRVAP